MKTWNDIWKSRYVPVTENLDLECLLRLNGYDGDQSRLTPKNLQTALRKYESLMNLDRGERIYEVGCGTGALLANWYSLGYEVGGCDLSNSLIGYAKKAFPKGNWSVLEADKLRIKKYYDHYVAFGLFMYFPDYEYAKRVVCRMLINARKSVSIFDIPDLAKKLDSEDTRRRMIPDYETKYATAQHLYYSKEWWVNISEDLGVSCHIYDQNIQGYENSRWRFNVTFSL